VNTVVQTVLEIETCVVVFNRANTKLNCEFGRRYFGHFHSFFTTPNVAFIWLSEMFKSPFYNFVMLAAELTACSLYDSALIVRQLVFGPTADVCSCLFDNTNINFTDCIENCTLMLHCTVQLVFGLKCISLNERYSPSVFVHCYRVLAVALNSRLALKSPWILEY